MIRLTQSVGPVRGLDGSAASNCPKDLHAVGERFLELGFLKQAPLPRTPDVLKADAISPSDSDLHKKLIFEQAKLSAAQTGFFNRERVVELTDHHDWGTSWLADVIQKAGQFYRNNYLAAEGNQFAALITLNDGSLSTGGASPDHFGHQTGLAIDLLLPRKDGTVRRSPTSIAADDGLYDRSAMNAMLKAFHETKHVQRVDFFDADAGEEFKNLFASNPVCKRHAQVWIKPPKLIEGSPAPAGLTDKLADLNAVARNILAARFVALGYYWAADAKVKVLRHVFEANGQPKREGKRYAVKEETYDGLEWAVRLFKAIIKSQLIVDQRKSLEIALSDDDLKWLFAKNAPRWQPLPIGTVEASNDLLAALNLFAAVVRGRTTTHRHVPFITPHDEVEQWLFTDNAPRWGEWSPKNKYTIAPLPHHHARPVRPMASTWTIQFVESAAEKYTETAQAVWPSLVVQHPATLYPGDQGTETGLRVRVSLIGHSKESLLGLGKAFQAVGALPLVMKVNTKLAEANDLSQVGITRDDNWPIKEVLEIHVPKQAPGLAPPSDGNPVVALVAPKVEAKPIPDAPQLESQPPRLCFITPANAPTEVKSLGLQILLPQPSQTPGGTTTRPLLFELPLKQSQSGVLEQVGTGNEVANVVPASKSGPTRAIARPMKLKLDAEKETRWDLDLSGFLGRTPFARKGFEAFDLSRAQVVFEKGFESSPDAPPTKASWLECEFGRGLLTKPITFKIALTGSPDDAITNQFTVEWVSAADAPRRKGRPTPSTIDDPVVTPAEYAKYLDATVPSAPEADREEADAGGNLALFEGWRVRFPLKNSPLSLPVIGEAIQVKGNLDLLLSSTGQLATNLNGELNGKLDIPLGSSMVRLLTGTINAENIFEAKEIKAECNLGTLGFALRLAKVPSLVLALDPFKNLDLGGKRNAVLANVFEGDLKQPLVLIPLLDAPADAPEFTVNWRLDGPRIPSAIFDQLHNAIASANPGRSLASLAGKLLGDNQKSRVQFSKPDGTQIPVQFTRQRINDGELWQLTVKLKVEVLDANKNKAVLAGQGDFHFEAETEPGAAFVQFKPGSFACSADNILTVANDKGFHSTFGSIVSLHIPNGSRFRFLLDPNGPKLSLEPPTDNAPPPMSLRVPASKASTDAELLVNDKETKNFAFELDRFSLHPAGLDLRAGVRANNVSLGETSSVVFDAPLRVQPAEKPTGPPTEDAPPRVGEVVVKNGRLVAGSLRASARLPYFDDATGTLGLVITEDADGKRLDCLGTFDVTGSEKFDLAALYARAEVTALHLETRYREDKWISDGEISGSVRFQPPAGRSAADLGPLAELFNGVTVQFEHLSLKTLAGGGNATLTVTCPPKSFRFADVLRVDLRGLELGIGSSNKTTRPSQFKLLGDVTLEKLPGVDSSLTFGGITLIPGAKPKFRVSRIGGRLALSGGFKMEGVLEHIENADEVGFVGSFGVETSSFPRVGGVVKLTRIRTLSKNQFVPSLAVFLEADFDAALFAGFFLRRIGAGLGLRQGLRGLKDDGRPLSDRIVSLVNDPAGLPEPRRGESWVPLRPDTERSALDWAFVATGLITFGKQPPDQPHTFAGTVLLAIDRRLDLVLAVNAWLFTSPDDTLKAEFQQRPVVRGAVALSVRDRKLFAFFRSLPNPKMGDKAPALLRKVLEKAETTLSLSADQHGFLLEVGWPWETKVDYPIGPFQGELRAGFRFGIYRGILTFGLNFAIALRLETREELSAGPAKVALSVSGRGYFRAAFAGAVTRDFRTYLLGEASVGATLNIAASVSWSIRVKIGWKKFSKTFRKNAKLSASVHAGVKAAITPDNRIGFTGTANLSLSVCGFRVSGRANFRYDDHLIGEVESELNRLQLAQTQGTNQQTQLASQSDPHACWNYRFCRLPNGRVRVVFFPSVGSVYPTPSGNPEVDAKRFKIKVKAAGKFVGMEKAFDANTELSWSENLAAQLLKEDDLLAGLPADEKDGLAGKLNLPKSTLGELLTIPPSQSSRTIAGTEVRDERTRKHGPSQSDDETAAIAEQGVRSPNLPTDSKYDELVRKAGIAADQSPDRKVFVGKSLFSVALTSPSPETIKKAFQARTPGTTAVFVAVPDTADVWHSAGRYFAVRSEAAAQTVSFEDGLNSVVATSLLDSWSGKGIEDPRKIDLTLDHIEALSWFGITPLVDTQVPANSHKKMGVSRLHRPENPALAWTLDLFAATDTPERSFLIGIDSAGRVEVVREDGSPEKKPLDPGLLLAELLEFARAPDADGYDFAPHMRLVLEFIDPNPKKPDPVPDLIDLEAKVEEGFGFPAAAGEDNRWPLRSVVDTSAGLPEYDLIIEDEFQSADRICLAWDFVPERPDEANPLAAYRELEQYVVTRVHTAGESLEPKIVTLRPAWVDGPNGELIRPQFQFVDDDVTKITHGHRVHYTVEARSPDRILASAEFTVTRRIVEPLPPLPQSVAVQRLGATDEASRTVTVAVTVDRPTLEELNGKTLEVYFSRQLQVRYRLVPCSTVGFYGFDAPHAVDDGYEQPANRAVDVRFPDSSSQRPVPWTDTRPLTNPPNWRVIDDRDSELLVLAIDLKDSNFDWPIGHAVELHVGREISPRDGKPLLRSVLARCRHSVFTRGADNQLIHADGGLNTKLGNTVAAIERVPSVKWEPSAILPDRLRYEVKYPEFTKDDEEVSPPTVTLSWQHELTGRTGFDQPVDGAFDPVVGYHLDSYDRLETRHYTQDNKLVVRDIRRQTVLTVPDAIYRAAPSSILVHAVKTEFNTTTATTLDEAVANRESGQFAATPGNWKPAPRETLSEQFTPAAVLYELVQEQQPTPEVEVMVYWPGGPVWLDRRLMVALVEVGKAVKAKTCRLTLNRPLVNRVPDPPLSVDPTTNANELRRRIDKLCRDLDVAHDPYGWHSAEALGRACEAVFVDKNNRAIRAELVEKAIKQSVKSMAVCGFLADDNQTLLNVLRFVLPEPPPKGEAKPQEVARAVILQTLGMVHPGLLPRKPTEGEVIQQLDAVGIALVEACVTVLTEIPSGERMSWLAEIHRRLEDSGICKTDGDPAVTRFARFTKFAEDPRHDMGDDAPSVSHPLPRVPISQQGRVEIRITLGDGWYHKDCYALRPVCRYDLIRRAIQEIEDAPPTVETGHLRGWTTVRVDRTKALVPPKIVASPLVSGVQFIALRHPAEFATIAAADNAARIQFGGFTLLWPQRRPVSGLLEAIQKLKLGTGVVPNWKAHVDAVTATAVYFPKDAPPLNHPALSPVLAGTATGIYGADRYVLPDVPAYYEYRTSCVVTAGRRSRSSMEPTGWVQPLLESFLPEPATGVPPERAVRPVVQVPRVERVRVTAASKTEQETKVTLELDAAVLWDLLLPEFRPVWAGIEQKVKVDSFEVLSFGSLIDPRMEYQLYFRTDPIAKLEDELPTSQELLPLVRVSFAADTGQMVVKNQPPGVTQASARLVQPDPAGRIRLQLDLTFDNSSSGRRFRDQVASLQMLSEKVGDLNRLFAVQGQRDGALSELMEFTDRKKVSV